jgi:antitoxin (DNA-binding transcriptional repressor) of toxin-antitoxin stability system
VLAGFLLPRPAGGDASAPREKSVSLVQICPGQTSSEASDLKPAEALPPIVILRGASSDPKDLGGRLISGHASLDSARPPGYFATMRSVALKTLETQVHELVHLAEKGGTVLITEHDRVIAELSPPREAQGPFLTNPALAEAVRKGWITPAPDLSEAPPPRHPVAPTKELLEELDADRADR